MPLEILVRLLVDDVALAVLVLLLLVRLPRLVKLLDLQLLPQRHGVLYLGHIGEMRCVGDTCRNYVNKLYDCTFPCRRTEMEFNKIELKSFLT